jgi:hypothetical protein
MRMYKVLSVILLVAFAFAAGVKLGAHMGQQQFVLQEGSVKAALLVGELRVIRGGNAEKLIPSKEIELDGEIVKALTFRESGLPWLLWPSSNAYEHDRYLRSAAAYRIERPAAIPQLSFEENNPMADDMKSYGHLVRDRTEELVRDYGK